MTTTVCALLIAALGVWAAEDLRAAQAPAGTVSSEQDQAQPTTPSPPAGGQGQPSPPDAPYSYKPAGRRDPFVSLLGRGINLPAKEQRPVGLPGVLISEVALRGIVRSRGSYVAIVQTPDSRTYMVRQNDRLLDGRVKSITADEVVFWQEVGDPLSLVRQREIRKPLRPPEEGL